MPEFTKMMDGIAAAPPDAASKVINGLNSRGIIYRRVQV
jgi:hypothetical protein